MCKIKRKIAELSSGQCEEMGYNFIFFTQNAKFPLNKR